MAMVRPDAGPREPRVTQNYGHAVYQNDIFTLVTWQIGVLRQWRARVTRRMHLHVWSDGQCQRDAEWSGLCVR